MIAFIVRPFDTKGGIDFERVDAELIAPVLAKLGITGATTKAIAHAGNIRADMLDRLVSADLVIADISIHNANVYYELGVRHALRPRTTILIRARADDVPFDLKTDRYLEYDAGDPGGSRADLELAVDASVRAAVVDSPVYAMLPALEPPDPANLHPVPEGFIEDVSIARGNGDRPLLAVLAEEAQGFDWGVAGARLVAEQQFELGAWDDARATLEYVHSARPDDLTANLLLGTVYQRLGRPVESDAAITRVLECDGIDRSTEAEALALLARNAKDCWTAEWQAGDAEQRAAAALRSPWLERARVAYDEAFMADQNHFYPGLNVLCLTTITLGLADLLPHVWDEPFDDERESADAIAKLERHRDELRVTVRRALEADRFRAERRGHEQDVWAHIGYADLRFLTSDKPAPVAAAYRQARTSLAAGKVGAPFPVESAARQIRLFSSLGIATEKATAALEALGAAPEEPPARPRTRIIVFSGHRLDAPDREHPRFPAESAETAAGMIRAAVAAELELADGKPIEGIAGGASGGDILFHEICAELGIPTTLLLAIPKNDYAAASVNDAGPDWMERFRTLTDRLDVKVLSQDDDLPGWLAVRDDYSIWERNNRWTLHTATSRSEADVTLIVLWNGEGGDGPGGTADMVSTAHERGVRVIELDATKLLEDLPTTSG